MRSFRLLFSLLFLITISHKHYAQSLCSDAQPVCAGVQNIFPGETTGNAQAGPNYLCLSQQPNPSWHTLEIATSGAIGINMFGTASPPINNDIDFICYGPFTSTVGACSQLSSGTNIVACSFSGSGSENFTIPAATAGQFYILLVTNYAGALQDVVITQTGGSGSLNCASVCDITGITNTISACSALNTYSVSGVVSVNGVPTVGTLTITNSCGGTPIVYNAPFPSPITYSFTNLPANGSSCGVTAKFSSLTTCTLTSNYTAPSMPAITINPSSNPLCLPGSETLTASGATNYTWSTGSTSNPVVVNPSSTTTYTVVGSNPGSCRASAAITITTGITPTVSAFSIPFFVCSGASATLIATGALSFTWQPGSLTGNTVVINPTIPTTYTVTGTLGVCSNTASTFVNVIAGPVMTANTSSATICPAQTVTLSATGALSYTWFPGGEIAPSITVAPSTTTSYSVVGSNAFGCTSTVVLVQTVTPVPAIVISPASPTLCAGSSIALSASGASTYTWNPGNLTGSSINVSPSANTTYTVTGSNGTCSNTAMTTVTVVPLPTVGASASSPSICSGQPVTLTGSGATSYVWNPGGMSGANVVVNPTSTTSYTVTGTLNGCSNTAVTTVNVFNGPAITPAATPTAICPGGSATLSATGAMAYTWMPGGLTTAAIVVNPSSTTVYSVTGAGASGCTTTTVITLVVNSAPSLSISASSPSVCAGGSATLTASGATSYVWNPGGSTGASIVVSPATNTTYSVTGTSALGCTAQISTPITVVALPVVGATSNPTAICSGGTATLTGSGAINYTWNPGNLNGTSVLVSPVATTVYTVTGSNGCTGTSQVTVVVNSSPAIGVIALPANICAGGTSTLIASGGASYVWSTGQTTSSIVVTPVSTTVYTVVGSNGAGCSTIRTVTVTVNPAPSLTLSASSTSVCAGGSTSLSASGGFNYTWTPGPLSGANVVVTPVATTIYTASAVSAFGCRGQNTILITVVPLPVVGASSTPTSICIGGSATLNGTGATNYTWNPGNLTGNSVVVSPTSNTTYTVTGSSSGCSGTALVSVIVNSGPVITVTASPASICSGGSSTLTASGAASYTWAPLNLTGSSIVVTPSVTTIYTVTGNNGSCTSSRTVMVTVNPAPAVFAVSSSPSVCAGSSATLTAGGAITYTWNPGNIVGNNVVVTPSSLTSYTVTGTGPGGCTGQTIVDVGVIPIPVLSASSMPASICVGGMATLSGSGATNYTWNPGNLTGSSVNVSPSSTTVYNVIGETGGCTATSQVTVVVNNNPSLTVFANPSATICPGGTTTLTATGATNYTWNPGNLTGSSISVSPLVTTIYNVIGSNGTGCTSTETVEVTVTTSPGIVITAAPNDSICAGSSATLTASGATSYVWNPGGLTGNSILVSPSSNTTYTATGTSGAGCTGTASMLITVLPIPVVGASSNPPAICSGNIATLTGSGATNYTWNPGNLTGSSVNVSPSSTTVYNVTGETGGCSATSQVTVVVNTAPSISVLATPPVICPGGSSTLTASGATNYTWSPVNLNGSTIVVSPSVSTVYSVIGDNGTGCVGTRTVIVLVGTPPSVSAAASPASICQGQSSNLTASGATFYSWNPGGMTGSNITVSPSTTTNYTVTGSTLAGCTGSTIVTVTVTPAPSVTATAAPGTLCNGQSSTLTASGANSYQWLPMNTTGSSVVVSPSSNTTYTLIGDNGGGCTDIALITVSVNSAPVVSINGPASICVGQTATLSASGTLSYLWMPTGETTSDIVVSPNVTTTYTVTGSNGAGCSAAAVFTLNVGAASNISITATPPQVCQGHTTTLVASGGTSYTWAAGIGNGSTIFSNPMITTTYTVYSDNGVCTSSAAITVTVNPLPTLIVGGTPSVICAGQSVTLSASGANSYTWNPGGLNGATVIDTPPVTTDYTVTGENGNGCTNTTVVTVTVLSTPAVVLTSSPPAVCIGGSAVLNASGATAYTLEPGTQTGTSFTVTPTANTTYTLYGDNGGCANGTAVLEVTVNPLPSITANASAPVICGGTPVTLTASGGDTYTWNPTNAVGSSITDNPLVSTEYTVSAQDINGCFGSATVSVSVNPQPTLNISATSTILCQGDGVTLTAGGGAVSYTWEPGTVMNAVITDTPSISTTYTVSGQDAIGCVGSETILITVVNVPTITVAPLHTPVCEGSTVTFTATGATSYTWMPSGVTTDTNTETPVVTSNYTVIGDNGGGCVATYTFDVFVNPIPTGLTASASGSITCQSPTVDLFGSSTSTNVSYSWTGPQSFTSAAQNPTAVTVWGVFTLSVSDMATGCVATTTTEVITDGSIPLVTATTSGSITCSVGTVTLDAVHTTTNPAYAWMGPNGFTATTQSFTTSVAGIYTVTVTDLSSNCKAFNGVEVGTHTNVTITSSIAPATCSNSIGNNDGTIILSNFGPLDKFDLVSGTSYTGAATYTNANTISSDGIVTSNLANPTTTLAFTLRLFDSEGCTKDTTLFLTPTDCVPRTMGLAKEVSAATVDTSGYTITYTVVAKNYDTANALTNVTLSENLSQTFPLPTTFSVISSPTVMSIGSSLVINPAFDGSSQTSLTDPLTSTLSAGKADTIVFTVRVKTNGVFGPFNNWIVGDALNSASVTVQDTSTAGMDPSFPIAGNPNGNSLPTVISFTPVTFFGITKTGIVGNKLSDNTYDIAYSITVHNLGNDTLYNVVLKDSIFESTIRRPATYTIKAVPSSDGNLVANTFFDGRTDINLVTAASKMPPGSVNTINFVINAALDTVTVIKNSAYGNCLTRTNETLSDTSNAGTNPDSNNNGVWNEPADNMPTVLTITNHTLFIPQGFSPDGDAINQFFVIQGLPVDGSNEFTVFNRWGNKVYHKANYDNTWEGYPNVSGTVGGDKLPQGTYYYILDMKGSGIKPISGFIVIQY